MINGGFNGFPIRAIFRPRRRVKKTSNKHSVLPFTLFLLHNLHKCIKSRRSYFNFATFKVAQNSFQHYPRRRF